MYILAIIKPTIKFLGIFSRFLSFHNFISVSKSIPCLSLLGSKKPGPVGQVRDQWLWLKNRGKSLK